MGWLEKRCGKKGTTYRLCVQDGDEVRRLSWRPPAGMSEKQAEKAANKALIDFEQSVRQGLILDKKMTLDELLDKWFSEYAVPHLKPYTVYNYRLLRSRISESLGKMRVDRIRASHIMKFYDSLSAEGARRDIRYTATQELCEFLNGHKPKDVAAAAKVGEGVIRRVIHGQSVSSDTAVAISEGLGFPLQKAFGPNGKGEKLTGNTQLHYHRFLNTVFNKAVKWGILAENPCNRVDPPKMERDDVQFMDEKEIAALLEAIKYAPPQYSAIVQLALLTGCRRAELCGLRWSDIDFEKSTLTISRTLQWLKGNGLVFGPTKTAKSKRTIKLGVDTLRLLDDWRTYQNQEKENASGIWVKTINIGGEAVDNDLLFTNADGSPFDPGNISSWFPRFLREHNLPQVRFHSLRHTNASLLIAAYVPVTTVSARLGHSKTSTTTDIYAGPIRSADAAAAAALDDVFEKIKGINSQ